MNWQEKASRGVVAAPLRAGELLQNLGDPENSLSLRSSFGEDLNSDCSSSVAPPTVVIAHDAVETQPVQTQQEEEEKEEDSPSEAPIREVLANALMAMADAGGDGASLSLKRSRAAR
ncbi:hypothetical protein NKR19_g6149 [Coniochaeta hoffmannii]|uniref:Uncharacterized protein n=1 Tax=Coniochaeta hoffmannii TaxID=91930 RepID=A0AA38RTQ2_9PEZI|nr:hypothetical protein NKR19_g6149 [Coniochaeta hoffmannii]